MDLRSKFRSLTANPAKDGVAPQTGDTSADQETSSSTNPQNNNDKSDIPEVAPVIGAAAVTEESAQNAEHASEIVEYCGREKENNGELPIVVTAGTNAADPDKHAGNDIENNEEIENESEYPSGLKLSLLCFGLCMAIFTVALDNT